MTWVSDSVPKARAAMTSARTLLRKKRNTTVGRVPRAEFERLLDRFDDETVIVYAGLSDVRTAFQTDPYEYLLAQLDARFESILVPGYTPSFKRTGIYHTEYSRPEYGMFPALFMGDSEYRTPDPLHSILVDGSYRFGECEFSPTFGANGCFAQLAADNVLALSIGTWTFRSTQIHQVECEKDVPYVRQSTHDGVMYTDESSHHEVSQTNYTNEDPRLYAVNKAKLESRLEAAGVMESYSLDGLRVYAVHAGDLNDVLGPEVERDPYYLVT